MEERIVRLEEQQISNHKQNRADIHKLFNGQESIMLAMTAGLDKIGDKISGRCKAIEEDVVELRIWRAKAMGYIAGASVFGGILFELGKGAIDKLLGHL